MSRDYEGLQLRRDFGMLRIPFVVEQLLTRTIFWMH